MQDFKESPISRGRDHWDLEKWQTQVKAYMEEMNFGPVTERNIDCFILLLRSTIIKKPAFKRRADPSLERHFLDIFNEPTIARIRGFFRHESFVSSLWLHHVRKGRLDESV